MLEAKLKTVTTRMNAYESEKIKLSTKIYHQNIELEETRLHSQKVTEMIKVADQREQNRQWELEAEKERNIKMQEEVYEADAALHKAQTTTLFSLQQTNAELELKVA